eukprot:5549362-Alexandrium_andersonii.AAC.1
MRRRRALDAEPQILVAHGQVPAADVLARAPARQRNVSARGVRRPGVPPGVSGGSQAIPAGVLRQ